MAKKTVYLGLAPETMVEIVKVNIKTGVSEKREMTYGEWLRLKKQAGFNYLPFQLGYSSFKNKK